MTYIQEQVNLLKQMTLMMTGKVEKENSRGGENAEAEVVRTRRQRW